MESVKNAKANTQTKTTAEDMLNRGIALIYLSIYAIRHSLEKYICRLHTILNSIPLDSARQPRLGFFYVDFLWLNS